MDKDIQYSIVMPAYNTEQFIGEAIRSIFNQTVSDWELIVINDGSTDRTAEIIKTFCDPRIRIFSQENEGISASRNKGIELSRGDFIIFFDSDDRLYLNALERLGAAIKKNDDLYAAYGESVTIDEAGEIIGTGKKPIFNDRPSGKILKQLLKKNFILPSAALIRKRVLQQTSGFVTDLELSEDWEMFCRLASRGDIDYVGDKPVVYYRLRNNSVRMIESYEKLCSKRMQCIEAVYVNPEIIRQVGGKELHRSRRMVEAAALSATACTALRTEDWQIAIGYLLKSVKKNPLPVRIREIILLCCALLRWLPYSVRRRLR